jgi:hypothetical protein
MVAYRIPTSAWSHNCGMHVVADYLIEQIQKENFAQIFRGEVYDELLMYFRNVFKKNDLTWTQIRQSTIQSSKIDTQIMLGYALRLMLPNILKKNAVYKSNMLNQFLALLELIKNGSIEEAAETYPILLAGNREYLETAANLMRAANEAIQASNILLISKYFNQKGFNDYCEAITLHKGNNFLWLGIDELTAFCQNFTINLEFNPTNDTFLNAGGLCFYNEGAHWERIVNTEDIQALVQKYYDSYFYKIYLENSERCFLKNIKEISEIYFSEKYCEIDMHSLSTEEAENKLNTSLEKVFKNKISDKFSLDLALKLSYDYAIKNKDYKQLYLPAHLFLLNKVNPNLISLNKESFKIIDLALNESLGQWLNILFVCLENNQNKRSQDIVFLLAEIFAKHICEAIKNNDIEKIKVCITADHSVLIFPGKLNPLHFALNISQYDAFKTIVVDHVVSLPHNQKEKQNIRSEIDTCFEKLNELAKDQYARTLNFRMDRIKKYATLKGQLALSYSAIHSFNLKQKLARFHLNESRIYLVDKQYEKSVHNAKIQATYIASLGNTSVRIFRASGIISNQGLIRFGLEMLRPYIQDSVINGSIYIGGKVLSFIPKITQPIVKASSAVNSYVTPMLGCDPQYTGEYLQSMGSNAISFAIMPHYYIASTILNNGLYYVFKDTGYSKLEAGCQVLAEALALSVNGNNLKSEYSQDSLAYQYQLDKNLSPFFGEYTSQYIASVVTICDQTTQNIDNIIGQYCSQFLVTELMDKIDAAMGDQMQSLNYIQQKKGQLLEWVFNYAETEILNCMSDSKFKNERLHVMQFYEATQLQQKISLLNEDASKAKVVLNELQSSLDKEQLLLTELSSNAKTSPDILLQQQTLVSKLQNEYSSSLLSAEQSDRYLVTQSELLIQSYEKTETLYQKTEGFVYYEAWRDAYLNYKYAQVKFNSHSDERNRLKLEEQAALEKCKYYNSNAIKQTLEPWAKSMDELYEQYKDNFPNGATYHDYINRIIDKGFSEIEDRNQLGAFIANKIISTKYPFYPEMGDKEAIEAERKKITEEIVTHELHGYKRKAERSKNRLYDYFFAKINNTEKKRHYHQWEKILKHFANEVLTELIGWKPFKEFHGGEDRPGRAGIQFSINSNQANVSLTAGNDIPVCTLYETKPKEIKQIAAPTPQITSVSLPVASISELMPPIQAIEYVPATLEDTSCSSLSVDNPFIRQALDRERDRLFPKIFTFNSPEKDNIDTKNKAKLQPQVKSKANSSSMALGKEKSKTQQQKNQYQLQQAVNTFSLIFNKPKNTLNPGSAWSLIYQNTVGDPRRDLTLGGARQPEISSEWLSTLVPQLAETGISVTRLPSLVWEALGESGQELIQGAKSLVAFGNSELMHISRLEVPETVYAVKLLSQFVSDEAARAMLGQDLKSKQMMKQVISEFNSLSPEEKFKFSIKLCVSILAPGGVLKIANASGKATAHVLNAVSKAQRMPFAAGKVVNASNIGTKSVVGGTSALKAFQGSGKQVENVVQAAKNTTKPIRALPRVTLPRVAKNASAQPLIFSQNLQNTSRYPLRSLTENGFTNFAQNKVKSLSVLALYDHHKIAKMPSFQSIEIRASSLAEIAYGCGDLSKRQLSLLERLPKRGSEIMLHKSSVNMIDLAALTAKSGAEFAVFTLGAQRIIIRGDKKGVYIGDNRLAKIKAQGWKWSAHTHPGTTDIVLNASGFPGDRQVLLELNQERSLILNSAGRKNVFDKDDNYYVSSKKTKTKLKP